jgi:hypothetical protein
MYRKLYVAFIDQFVVQSQGLLSLRCSVNSQILITNRIAWEERKQGLKRVVMYFGEICSSFILISWENK